MKVKSGDKFKDMLTEDLQYIACEAITGTVNKVGAKIELARRQALKFDIDDTIQKIKELNIPYVHVDKGCFSNSDTIMITISIEYKKDWSHGYLQNSKYANFHFDVPNMKLEKFSGSLPAMRKCKIKSADHLITKIKEYYTLHKDL